MSGFNYDLLKYFFRSEFSDPDEMDSNLLLMLDHARHIAGIPFRVTSSFRSGDLGAHGRGLAVDIACRESHDRFRMVKALFLAGFNRIGVYEGHIHVDVDPKKYRGVLWIGRYPGEGVRNEKEANVSEE